MDNQPFFSVIVPAHNAEKYLDKSLTSVTDQTFTDYELIVVCDACTDNTETIAKKYTDKVYVCDYHRDGATRNVGLNHAQGKWIVFLDADDWFLHEFVFHMLNAVLGLNHEDILLFSFIWKNMGYIRQTKEHFYYAVWNKVWRREYIGDYRFTDEMYTSDKEFTNRIMQEKPPHVIFWDMPMYYYNFLSEGSLNSQIEAERRKENESERKTIT